jgi:hypothetical protein
MMWKVIQWGAETPDISVGRFVLIGAAGAAIAIGLAIAWRWASPPIQEAPAPVEVLFECYLRSGAIKIPADGRIFMLNLRAAPEQAVPGGLFAMTTAAPEYLPFGAGSHRTFYQCRLVNYGKSALFKVHVELTATFRKPIRFSESQVNAGEIVLERPWSFEVTPLNPGIENPFIFYLWSTDANFCTLTSPQTAAALENSKPIQVSIIAPSFSNGLALLPSTELWPPLPASVPPNEGRGSQSPPSTARKKQP